ncbi:MAG: ammonium transporter [Actinomycetota bacterium]
MEVDTGDTAWMLASAALVMFMTPGLAFFYGGLVRNKNVLGTIMHSFIALGMVTLIWIFVGYTLAFGTDIGGFIGGMDFAFLRNVGAEPGAFFINGAGSEPVGLAPTIPHTTFMVYQMMFAIITPALISGAIAERMKFKAYLLFISFWSLLIYSPVAHWVFGGGFLGLWDGSIGALDFAGGTVVHINAGAAALAAIIYMGKRKGYPQEAMRPHNIPMVVLGASILWFGWFGFNGGSAAGSGALASAAFTNTQIAAALAILGWLIPEWLQHGAPTTVGAATGAVAGLVAITPAAGYVEPMAAVVIGLLAGLVCYGAVALKPKLGYDDSLDVVGVHLVGGILGAVLTGFFATTKINGVAADGLFYGNPELVADQLIAVLITMIFSFVGSFVLLFVIDKAVGLRLSDDDEQTGLDLSQHAEVGYSFAEGGGGYAR